MDKDLAHLYDFYEQIAVDHLMTESQAIAIMALTNDRDVVKSYAEMMDYGLSFELAKIMAGQGFRKQ